MGSNEHTKSLVAKCPSCGYKIDGHSAIDGGEDKPKKDDLSICFKCAVVNKYDEDLQLVLLTEEELTTMDPVMQAEVQKNVEKIKAYRQGLN
jgi:hypothetical protein